MPRFRFSSWVQGLLLTVPLVIIVAWITHGFVNPPEPAAAVEATASAAAPRVPLAGLPPPEEDLPAARLEDHVDGAADYLRGNGCRRLLAWRITEPPADLEILVFDEAAGAQAVLARDAGPERQPGPGDEASVAEGSILFRRGAVYARLFADPSARPRPGSLLDLARKVDTALNTTERKL